MEMIKLSETSSEKEQKEDKKKSRVSLEELKNGLDKVRKIWMFFITNLVVFSIAFIFIISFINSDNKSLTLETMNSWVSLILGLVATFMSVISMWMSFYNLERTNEINEINTEQMKELKDTLIHSINSKNDEHFKQTLELKRSIEDTIKKNEDTIRELKQMKSVISKHMGQQPDVTNIDDSDLEEWESIE